MERGEKFIAGIHRDQFGVQMIPKRRSDLLAFILSQQASIHKHRHELIADGFMHQRRRDG
jgi:hypothetical protein